MTQKSYSKYCGTYHCRFKVALADGLHSECKRGDTTVISISSCNYLYEYIFCIQELFIKKIELCCTTFDFYDTQNYLEDKAVKLQTMEELIIYTTPDSDIYFSEAALKTFIRMIKLNLLRSPDLTLTREEEIFGICDEDEIILELIWHNLQPVYQLFLNIVVHKNLDINQAKRQFNIEFISRFTDLFDRDDAREREYVKTLLHRIYGRFLSYRSMIRRMMAHRFYEVIYEGRRWVYESFLFLYCIFLNILFDVLSFIYIQ